MDTKKLRQKILDLAIHGKLVPQDPNDEPASVLLERIRAEKEKLIREGKIKAPKKSKSAGDTSHYPKEVPFEVPKGWVWTTIGDRLINRDGERIPVSSAIRKKQKAKLYDYYGAAGVIDKVDDYLFNERLLLVGEDGANLLSRSKDNAFFAEGKYWVNNHAHIIDATDKRLLEYIALYINAIPLDMYVTGSAQPKLNQDNLNRISVPLPPLAEQFRIARAVEDCKKIVNGIENNQVELQETIDHTKQKILSMAIAGKLVSQDPSDEPALELLRRINQAFRPSDNPHYEGVIPDGWQICKLSDLFKVTMGQSPDGTSLNRSTGIEFHQGKICFTEKYLSESDIFTTSATKCAEPNSLLCCVRAPVGVFNITSRRICIGRGLCSLSPLDADVDIEYWFYALSSLTEYYESMATGSTFKAISGDIIRNTVIAVPPKMEQQRILEQITCLFSILKKASDAI